MEIITGLFDFIFLFLTVFTLRIFTYCRESWNEATAIDEGILCFDILKNRQNHEILTSVFSLKHLHLYLINDTTKMKSRVETAMLHLQQINFKFVTTSFASQSCKPSQNSTTSFFYFTFFSYQKGTHISKTQFCRSLRLLFFHNHIYAILNEHEVAMIHTNGICDATKHV